MPVGLSRMRAVQQTLPFRQPYDADPLFVFLRRRTVAGIEHLEGDTYARTVRLPTGPAAIRLTMRARDVEATIWAADPAGVADCVRRARALLDLDADPSAINRCLAGQPGLGSSVAAYPGLRVVGHVEGFEVAVRAVVGQQISVSGARTLLGRLVAAYGEDLDAAAAGPGLTRLFPTAQRLATVDPAELPMPRSRGRALVAIAEAVAAGELVLDRTLDRPTARRRLLALPGVGPWTADYIALRAFGDPDVFMSGDLGVRRGLARLGLPPAAIDACRPWRSYAMMHVWQALEEP